MVLTMIGNITISATIVMRGRRLSGPNQLSVIGANAMIGIVLAPIATGSRTSRALAQRAVAKPAAVPSATPTISPTTASVPVNRRPRASVDQSVPSCSTMTVGRGMRNDWTPRTWNPTSQTTSTKTNTPTAGSQSRAAAAFTRGPRRGRARPR